MQIGLHRTMHYSKQRTSLAYQIPPQSTGIWPEIPYALDGLIPFQSLYLHLIYDVISNTFRHVIVSLFPATTDDHIRSPITKITESPNQVQVCPEGYILS